MSYDPIPGLYEQLVTEELERLLRGLEPSRVHVETADAGDTHVAVANHLRRILERALHAVPENERLTRQAVLCNAVLGWLRDGQAPEAVTSGEALVVPLTVLREVRALSRGAAFSAPTPQPLVPLSSADLLVNARGEPSVGAAIEREIHSADRIDLLCAFIRWNGLRTLRPALEAHRQAGRPLRVITTVYTGSTERRALDWLASIGADVKVSYDTRTTRLHAKAWLFERLSGYSTAFIGSSNLTHSAMLDGVEWNVRLAQASTPDLIEKFKATFESYWADPDYEPYDPARDAERFDRAVRATVFRALPDLPFRPAAMAIPARDAPATRSGARAASSLSKPRCRRNRHRQDPRRCIRLPATSGAACRIPACYSLRTAARSCRRA